MSEIQRRSRCCQAAVRRVFRIAPGNDVVECRTCGLQYAEVYPPVETTDEGIYDLEYFRPDFEIQEQRGHVFEALLSELEGVLGRGPGRLLDIGAGDGALMRAAISRGWTAEGTDISSAMVGQLRSESHLNVHLGVVEEIDLPERGFDAIVLNHVLEHVEDPVRTLATVRRLLTEDGVVRVEVPNLASLSSRVKNFQSRWKLKKNPWKHYSTQHHFWYFTPRTLASTFERAGLDIVDVRAPARQWGEPAPWMRLVSPVVDRMRLGGHLVVYGRPSRPPSPRRIALVRPRGLGDVVLSTAMIDALRRAYPHTPIDYLSEAASRTFLEIDDRIDRIFLLGGPSRDEGRIRWGGRLAAVRWLREGGTDLVLDSFSNPATAIITGLSGAARRVGWKRGVRGVAYNVRVPRFHGDPATDARFAVERMLDFLRDAGIRWEGEARANAPTTPEDREFARAALTDLGYETAAPFGAVLPGGSWESKRWTVEGFAAAGEAMALRFGSPTLVIWGPPEEEDARAIAEALGDRGRLAPASTLRQMGALLGTPALLVAPDCLGRHLSIVQGVPTVAVFGSTDPLGWTPTSGPHRAVAGRPEDGYESLRDLPVEIVVGEIDGLIREWDLDRPPVRAIRSVSRRPPGA